MEKFNGKKVFSMHAPLGFLDYDGPGEEKAAQAAQKNAQRARQYVYSIAKKSQNYRH